MGLKAVFFKQFFWVFLHLKKGGFPGYIMEGSTIWLHLNFPG